LLLLQDALPARIEVPYFCILLVLLATTCTSSTVVIHSSGSSFSCLLCLLRSGCLESNWAIEWRPLSSPRDAWWQHSSLSSCDNFCTVLSAISFLQRLFLALTHATQRRDQRRDERTTEGAAHSRKKRGRRKSGATTRSSRPASEEILNPICEFGLNNQRSAALAATIRCRCRAQAAAR
jgi:hypothetical protein